MSRLEGKTAIVTGGANGIGRATCMLLAQEGAKVAVTDIEENLCEQIVDEIEQSGGTARSWFLDVSDETNVRDVFAAVDENLGGITVLVNNAGIAGESKPTHQLSAEEWDQVMNVNVKGVFFCTKHAVPYMQQNGGGSIINLSSIYGIISAQDIPPYHASKGAVRLMSKTDALFYASDNIRVNSVHPGFIWTPLVEELLARQGDVDEGRRALEQRHPIGKVGDPEDIAYGIVYLASDESKFVTGSELVIDGGYTAR